jgi:two-component system, LuxR family, response regulator FixJ
VIFIVDDDDAVRDSLRTLLETFGLPVQDFASTEAFLADAEVSMGTCVILDVNLPGAGGLELLERLRRERPSLPVVMISGRADAAARARAIELGAAAFLDKPIAFDTLRQVIAEAGIARNLSHP